MALKIGVGTNVNLLHRCLQDGSVQGNRVLTEEDLKQVILSPTGLQAFALDAHFEGGFPFQQVVENLT